MGVRAKGRSERARRGQKVLIGPWIHCLGDRGTNSRTGDIDFGAEALLDLRMEELRWFDYWLKGVDNGILDEPPVRVFVMGAKRWRLAREWPIPGTRVVAWYLRSQGGANSSQGDGRLDRTAPSEDEAPDRFVYDPHDPVPTMGGSTCCSEDITPVPMGPRDQRAVAWRRDVLVYDSEVLGRDLEVTGPIRWCSTPPPPLRTPTSLQSWSTCSRRGTR